MTTGTVHVTFEAASLDEGDIFLHRLTERGIIPLATYRSQAIYEKGDTFEVATGRLAETLALPDQLDVDVQAWSDDVEWPDEDGDFVLASADAVPHVR